MLILTRNIAQSIIIDGDIKVTVMGVKGGQVRIGIDVPDDVEIWREEIQKRIDAEIE